MYQMLPWYWYLYLAADGAQLVQLQRSRQGQGLLFRNMSINPLIARIHLEAIRRSTYMDLMDLQVRVCTKTRYSWTSDRRGTNNVHRPKMKGAC
ncbi:hypothetical protein V8C43DRAFT_297668 [Trichoderma afarasin]